jgi:hypothetical protein
VHRGDQYRRAIKLYYRKYGSYPTSIDQLMNTNQIRYLRKRYKDPMTNKDDWKLVYFGQAHVQPMGLFGQTLAGAGTIGAAGGVGQPIAGTTTNNNSVGAFGSSSGSAFGSSSGTSVSAFGGTSGSGFGSTSGSTFGSTTGSATSGSTTGGTDNSGTGFGSATGTGTGATGTTTGSAFGASGSTSGTLSGGVGPIVGVVIPDTRASIKEYKKQKHYNEWEFVYNPIEDQLQGALGAGQQNLNGATPAGAAGNTTGFGSNIGGATSINNGQNNGGAFGSQNGGTTSNPQQQPQQ